MDPQERQTFMQALTTEHFVLQTAMNACYSEQAARMNLYVFSLSSTLVAMGFAAQSAAAFMPFIATILPAVFILGIFTVVRLVDISNENNQFLAAIARIRGFYRTLPPPAPEYFSGAHGRWPETLVEPALQLGGTIGFLTTAASTVAFINSVVAAAGLTLLARELLGGRLPLAIAIGLAAAATLMVLFYFYQAWRHRMLNIRVPAGTAR